ncbi:hypothetical protein MMC08_003980 [Hypocenomyce scalaris]|nr:hypothetical protein [Hypocenomyce scalaris]
MTDNAPPPPGNFSYPQDGGLQFNYIDSLVTTWVTSDPNATARLISLWYYLDSRTQPWAISLNQSVPANGTKELPLDVANESYLGQLHLNYTAADGSPQKVLSPFFQVNHDSTQPTAVTWNQQALSTTSPSPTSQISVSPAIPTSKISATSTPTLNSSFTLNPSPASLVSSLTPSPSPAAKGSSLSGGAITGIVVGALVGVGLGAALLMILRVRRRKRVQSEDRPPPFDFPPPLQEKDGHPRPENELSGDGGLWELPVNRH